MGSIKRTLLISLACIVCFGFSACGCEHEFDQGVITAEATCTAEGIKTYTCSACGETKTEAIPIKEHTYVSQVTKEATFTETGELKYTCSVCGDSYIESIPIRDDEVIVTVTNKTNLAENWDAGRYSDRVEFTFIIENMTDKSIKGVQGILTVKDLFGSNILSINCDFTGQTIQANGSITVSELGMDINEFMDDHVKLYNEDYSDLLFEYEVSNVVFSDEQSSQNITDTASLEAQKVVVAVTNKINLSENWDAGRYSPRVEFEFTLTNKTAKDIKGIQGVLTIKDMFGADIISINCDFTGNTIPANSSISVSDLGMDINEFMDDHVKLYNENYSDLIFGYGVTNIVYTDGTAE